MEPRPPDPHQADGYLVVLESKAAYAQWRARTAEATVQTYYAQLRAALPRTVPQAYQGISRAPITRWWEGEAREETIGADDKARRRIRELLGPDPTLRYSQPPAFDPDLLPTLELAREILALVDAPPPRELIRVTRRTREATDATLGFDAGYWGSDHFSAVCDSMLMPRWHGPPVEAFETLQPWAKRLNEAQLFATSHDAHAFRSWYLAQPWAELEDFPDQIEVIRVDRAA